MTDRSARPALLFIVTMLAGTFLGSAPLPADPGLADQVIKAVDHSNQDEWFYTMTKLERGKTTIARHDPSRAEGERWTLVSVDGALPSRKDLESFQEDLDKESGGKAEEGDEGEVRSMIIPGSLELLEAVDGFVVYRFDPATDNEEDAAFYEHVDATLRIAKSDPRPYLESVSLVGREPFSPAFGVKVRTFTTVLSFAPVGSEGAVLPDRIQIRVVGRAMLVKKINEVVDVRFDDYRYVGKH